MAIGKLGGGLLGGWLREPLVHFLALGAVLLFAHRALHPARDRIVLGQEERAALLTDQKRRGGAPPSAAEEQALIARYLDSEVLYREALRLHLDRGDVIVRRRLVQKMEFLLEAEADDEPTEQALAAHLAANGDRYAIEELLTIEQVFLSADRRGAALSSEAAALRARLFGGAAPAGLGDPFPRGATLQAQSPRDLAAAFGPALAAALPALPPGTWSEPLRSPYGLHLLRVLARVPRRPATLAEVRERVRGDLRSEHREKALRAGTDRISARYQIEK